MTILKARFSADILLQKMENHVKACGYDWALGIKFNEGFTTLKHYNSTEQPSITIVKEDAALISASMNYMAENMEAILTTGEKKIK